MMGMAVLDFRCDRCGVMMHPSESGEIDTRHETDHACIVAARAEIARLREELENRDNVVSELRGKIVTLRVSNVRLEDDLARLREAVEICDQSRKSETNYCYWRDCMVPSLSARAEAAERRANEMHDEWQGACKSANEATKARQAAERKLERAVLEVSACPPTNPVSGGSLRDEDLWVEGYTAAMVRVGAALESP